MTLGDKIVEYRTRAGMTQDDLAEKIGTTAQNVYKYEKDLVNIPLYRLELLAKALNVSPTVLAGWDRQAQERTSDPLAEKVSRLNMAGRHLAESYIDYLLTLYGSDV